MRLHVAEQGTGPLVVLCHGFPECWYSWRHQLPVLADAGFHAVAPDMRGYGQSDRPHEIDQYSLFHLVGDMVGLLDALGAESAVIAGHDWGAPVAWHAALLRPDRFRAIIALSVPFIPRRPVRPTSIMPTGSPSLSPQGTESAGWCVKSKIIVFTGGANAAPITASRGAPGGGSSGAFIGVVGSSSRSTRESASS